MSNSWFFCHPGHFSLPHFPWVHVSTCVNQCGSFCHPRQPKMEESEEGEVSLSTGCPWYSTPLTGGEGGYWLFIILIVKLFINLLELSIYSSSSLGCRFRGRTHLTTVLEGSWRWQEPWCPLLVVRWAEVSGRSRSNSSSHTPQSAAQKTVISQVTPFLSPTYPSKIRPSLVNLICCLQRCVSLIQPFWGFLNPPLLPTPNNNKTQDLAC